MGKQKLSEQELELLEKTFFFAGVDRTVLERVTKDEHCECIVFTKGNVIYDRENYQKSLGILLRGAVEVSKGEESGHGLIMSVLEAGSLFGAAALFNDVEHYVTMLTAREKCKIVFFRQELVKKLIEENPEIAKNYIYYLSGRIHFLNAKIEGLIAGNAEQKLAHFLAGGTEQTEGAATVRLNQNLTRLAESLNLGRASLYRSFHVLEESGLIVRDGKTITITDIVKLRQF